MFGIVNHPQFMMNPRHVVCVFVIENEDDVSDDEREF